MPVFLPPRYASEVRGRYGVVDVVEHEIGTLDGGRRRVVTLTFSDWVATVAVTPHQDFVLVRQHRHGVDGVTLETAGGILDPGESPAEAAARELLEETGYAGGPPEPLGWTYPNPALQGNRCHFFLVRDARRVGDPHGDPHEHLEPVLLPRAELERTLLDGGVEHALSVVPLHRALARLGPLAPGRAP